MKVILIGCNDDLKIIVFFGIMLYIFIEGFRGRGSGGLMVISLFLGLVKKCLMCFIFFVMDLFVFLIFLEILERIVIYLVCCSNVFWVFFLFGCFISFVMKLYVIFL